MNPRDHTDVRQLLAQREWLARLARRLLGDGPDADDLTHETLTRALEAGTPRARTRGWLATVARNLYFERRRTDARRCAREEDRARPESTEDAEALDRAALRRELLDHVLKLDEPERTAVVLRYLEGLSYGEVAERQGVSVIAVRKRVSRAIDRLRDRLDERPGGRDTWAGLLAPVVGLERVVGPAATAASLPLASGVLAMSSIAKLALGGGALAALFLLVNSLFDPAGPEGQSPEANEPVHAQAPLVDLDALEAGPETREPATTEEADVEVDPRAPVALPAFPPRPESSVGTLELHVRWSDGTPAAGVSARIMPWGANDPFKHMRTVRTDESGIGVVDQLAPGKTYVYLDRGGGGGSDIVAGLVSVLEADVPAGATVRGRVLDPQGRPVGGATICLSAHGNRSNGFPVGKSHVDGRYEVRGVSSQRYLSARSARFAPSDQIYVAGEAERVIEIDLHLRGVGGSLAGIVLSPDGRPLVGARVLVTGRAPAEWSAPNDGGRRADEPLPFAVRTDETGRFELDEVGVGRVKVQARTERFMPWMKHVTVGADEPAEVEIRFVAGAALEGVVRHADGSPATGAYVTYGGGYGDFDSYRVPVGTDGSYRVVGLPVGAVELSASKRDRGKASTKLVLTRGTVARWDATLVEGRAAGGYVVDERGTPLAQWMVGVTDGRGLWSSHVTTDAEGRFSLSNLKANATTLTVAPPDGFQTGPSLFVYGALPAQGDLRIEIPDSVMPSASAALRVHVEGGPAPGGAQVIVKSRSPFTHREFHPDERGRVAIPRLRPGEYQLKISLPEYADRHLSFHVEAGEERDLGDVSLTAGGRVRLVLTGEGADGLQQAKVLDDSGVMTSFFDIEGGSGVSSLLPPGHVRLRIKSSTVAVQVIEGTVVEGEIVELQASVRPGTRRRVALRIADGSPFPNASSLLVFNAVDDLVQHLRFGPRPRKRDQSEVRLSVSGLELGLYRFVLETSDGRRAEADVSVTTLEPIEGDAATIVIE